MTTLELQGDFQTEVLEESRKQPVLVDFWAEWCAPCRMIGPVLEKLAAEPGARFKLVKLNTEMYPDIARQYNIQSIPAVKLFVDGQVAAEFVGALPEPQIRKWLEEQIPSEADKLFRAAASMLQAGQVEEARKVLEEVVQQDPHHHRARLVLAEMLMGEDPAQAKALLEAIPPESEQGDRAQKMLRLARQATVLSEEDLAEVEGHEPQKKWVERYLEGNRALAEGDYRGALEAWIDVMTFDRKLDDDGARQACIALFDHLGPDHELTREFYNRFSSALF